MYVGYKKITVVILLHFDKTPYCPEIIPQVQISGRPYATHHRFIRFPFTHYDRSYFSETLQKYK